MVRRALREGAKDSEYRDGALVALKEFYADEATDEQKQKARAMLEDIAPDLVRCDVPQETSGTEPEDGSKKGKDEENP